MPNLNLQELKEKVENHVMDWKLLTPKEQRKYREHYVVCKNTILDRIEKIEDCQKKLAKYESDVAEQLARLAKMKVVFFEEDKKEEEKKVEVETSGVKESISINETNVGSQIKIEGLDKPKGSAVV